jgi:uncharacterized protein
MTNPHGSFIWYELLTSDADAAQAFYEKVVGWSVGPFGDGAMDYRILTAPDGGGVGGLMTMPSGAPMRPGWFGYIGVDDVDRTVAEIEAAGGSVHMPAQDLEGVGRLAMVADPQGVPFYVMKGASPEASHAFAADVHGHCCWNELSTTDQVAAFAFYSGLFGWTDGGGMPMGEGRTYQFINQGDQMIGAMMTRTDGMPPIWTFYFEVPDIEVAAETVAAEGGTVHYGPAEVPGGDRIIVASDPQGAIFGLVGPGAQGEQS